MGCGTICFTYSGKEMTFGFRKMCVGILGFVTVIDKIT